jgi:hypothetical protein
LAKRLAKWMAKLDADSRTMGRWRDDLEPVWADGATGAEVDRALWCRLASEPALAGLSSLGEPVATANQQGDEGASEILQPILRRRRAHREAR